MLGAGFKDVTTSYCVSPVTTESNLKHLIQLILNWALIGIKLPLDIANLVN